MPSLLLLNGSPRGEHSNSMKMLTRLAQGWTSAGGGEIIVLHLAQKSDFKKAVALYTESDTVLLGMPLYADRLPGLVKEYFEELAISPGFLHTQHLPVTGFLVQSGFMEALHCRPLERYLQKLSGKISSGYAGTIVRGGGEALRSAPEESFHKLWKQLNALGAQLATQKRF